MRATPCPVAVSCASWWRRARSRPVRCRGWRPAPISGSAWIDLGVGMDAETLRRAVEPFYTTKGAGRGTGLGLSMVHGLAAQTGGALQLDSAPGRGTTATIYLPLAQMEAAGIA